MPLAPAPETGGESSCKPLERQFPVPPLASLVLGNRADDRPGASHEAAFLRVGQRWRGLHIEDRLDPGLRLLDVLAARAARTREPKLDLAERKLDGLPVADLDA
jgi:hypothetical protein